MTMKSNSLLSLAIASALTLTACGGGGSSGPKDPRLSFPGENSASEQEEFCNDQDSVFKVTEFVPADGATGVKVNASARVTFNANIDPDSIAGNLLLTNADSNPVTFVARPSGKSVVIDPTENLDVSTSYTITASEGLRADCAVYETEKYLDEAASATFTTDDETGGEDGGGDDGGDGGDGSLDTTPPEVTASSPENGETLAPVDGNILVEFSEAIDPTSVNSDNFVVTEIGEDGVAIGAIEGVINPIGNTIEFDPTVNLDTYSYYRVTLVNNSSVDAVTDLAGNELEAQYTFTFRSGGLVVILNDEVVSKLGGLGDALNDVGGTLLEPLEFGEAEDGLDNLDNALMVKVPLVDALVGALTGLADAEAPTTIVDGVEFADITSAAIGVCDPKSIDTSNPGAVDCAVALDLGLNLAQLTTLADAFTDGDVTGIPGLVQSLLSALTSGDLNDLPTALGNILSENGIFAVDDGLGVDLELVGDDSLPLPEPLEDALTGLLDTLGKLPLVGPLLDQNDGLALANVSLLEGELLRVDLGGLASIGILAGTERLIGENGILNLGGALFDTLLGLAPNGDSSGLGLTQLPLVGDLLGILDLSGLLGADGEGGGVGLVGSLLDAVGDLLALPVGLLSSLGLDQLPLVGDILGLLSPEALSGDDAAAGLPLVGDLLTQLTGLLSGLGLDQLPLVGDLLALLTGGNTGGDAATDGLGGLLDLGGLTGALTSLPLVGDLLNGLLGGLLGGTANA